ncbi:DUF4298 domain-containing protein [Moraxella sp. ZJ142]|uniref:DUF4298 domain-containing protein n=1 Tax=Moraxella marmotae TaxID=3344520 RepID=UPI0035D48564
MSENNLQAKLDHIQSVYRDWLSAKSALADAQQELERALSLIQEIETAYYSADFAALYQADAEGKLNTATEGEYSVMGEDTIYNEFIEKDQILWSMLKLCVKHLER